MGVIYKSTCIKTGKSYIGQTRRSLDQRKKQHECSLDNYYFHRAIQKHGKENFVWSIIEECDDALLNEREKYWIQKYDSYKNGYNSTLGGDDASSLDRWRENNPEKVLKNAINGLYYANQYHKTHRKENLEQLASVRQKGIDKVKRKVECIELHLIFDSLADAQRWSLTANNPNGKKASHQHISHVCRGSRNIAGGYHWRYVD